MKGGTLIGQRYRRMEDQKPTPWSAHNLDSAEGGELEPKVKTFSRSVSNWKP